ncbi:MAG: hypothetical protein ACLQLC_08165 [Candidatus Sulfotelmatobacter sp.]
MLGNFVKNRRGILQHLKEGRISKDEFAAYEFMLLSADAATGVWWGDSVELAAAFGQRDLRQEKAKDVLHGLEEKGYIKRFRQQGSRAKYPILINKYEITVGPLSDRLVDAGSTVDWRQPAVFTSCDETPVTPPVETPVRPPVVPPPYSRTQDNENSRLQETTTRPCEIASQPAPAISPGETETPAVGRPKGQTYSKLEDVPRHDQARILTSRIFIDLGRPKDKEKKLFDWQKELDPLCDQYEFPLLCNAVQWAITESPHWPQYIRRAANVVKNAEAIVDGYRAELRSKATYQRHQKQQAEKAGAPKNDARPEYKKDTTQFL